MKISSPMRKMPLRSQNVIPFSDSEGKRDTNSRAVRSKRNIGRRIDPITVLQIAYICSKVTKDMASYNVRFGI